MKAMKKTAAALLALLVLLFSLSACSSAAKSESYRTESSGSAAFTPTEPAEDGYWNDEAGYEKGDSSGTENYHGANYLESDFKDYKIIYTASLQLQTRDFDATLNKVYELLSRYGGYVASSSIDGTPPEQFGDPGRYAQIRVRVRAENLDAFLNETGEAAEVLSRNISTDDVTSSYFDTESRLKMYQTQYDRILEIMKKAETVDEVISLENELSRIAYEMDYLTGDLKRWDDLIAYSTVSLSITEKNTINNVETAEGFGEKVGDGFMATLSGVGKFFTDLAAGIIIYSPLILLLLVFIFLILLVIRLATRPKKVKNAPNANLSAPAANQPLPAEQKPEEKP